MPIFLAAVGFLLVMTAINGQYTAVGNAFEQDVLGGGKGGGFLNFIVGIIGIAAFFRLIAMPNAGKVFIVLVILAYLLKNANLLMALESIGSPPASASTGSTPSTTSTAATPASSATLGATPGAPMQLTGATPASPVGTVFAPFTK